MIKVLPLRAIKDKNMEHEEKKWGGAREGAGRKRMPVEQKRVNLTLKIKPDVANYLRSKAKEQNISIGKVVEHMVDKSI